MNTRQFKTDETVQFNIRQEITRMAFTRQAEKTNGRWAMIGFVCLLAYEAITGQALLG